MMAYAVPSHLGERHHAAGPSCHQGHGPATTWKGNEIRIKDYNAIKSAIEQYCVKNNVNHGPYIVRYKDSGNLASEGSFVDGKFDGWLRDFRESGKKKQEALFNKGTLKEKIKYDTEGNVREHKKF